MEHIPVLLNEVIEGLKINPDGVYIDATVGMGGHSYEIAKRLGGGRLIGLDRDQYALGQSRKRLAEFGDRVSLFHGNFTDIKRILNENGIYEADGILMDIGVSSPQLDDPERGFSYMHDGPLDMRMDRGQELTAEHLIASADESALEEIFWKYGEERWGRKIAQRIVKARQQEPIRTTAQLAEVVEKAIPQRLQKDGHPAKRVFQAIRIAVNDELGALTHALTQAMDLLNPGGRLCVITFHSLEDRIVKQFLVEQNRDCICPSDFPICVCDHRRKARIITRKPLTASDEEGRVNKRALSAKLRIGEKI